MSNQALNLLKLAVQACRNKQYDSAGVLLANASLSSDVGDFLELNMESDSFEDDAEKESLEVTPESIASSTDDSGFKRKRNSMHRISRMISAAAEAAEDDTEEDEFVDVDPDIPGEEAEPASFAGASESSETEAFELEVSESSPIRAK